MKGLGGLADGMLFTLLILYNVLEPLGNWGNKVKLSFKIVFLRLEQDIKKLKADLQASRQIEQELRSQISSLTNTERGIRSEIGQLRQENELLQNKYVFFMQLCTLVTDDYCLEKGNYHVKTVQNLRHLSANPARLIWDHWQQFIFSK